jgi:hypothetical protein
MTTPQTGIFALGTASHAYLEFDLTGDRRRLVALAAGLREPRTTIGGVNLVAGFRPELWAAVAPDATAPGVTGFNGPLVGPDDYTLPAQEDFTKGGPRYDFILDNVANHSMADTRHALTTTGTLQSNGGGHSDGRWLGSMGAVIKAAVSSNFARQQLAPSVKFQNRRDLVALKELVEAGKVTPVIDGTYPLSRTPEALGHVGQGHAQGTTVIAVAP